jgi:hypothetical protein
MTFSNAVQSLPKYSGVMTRSTRRLRVTARSISTMDGAPASKLS